MENLICDNCGKQYAITDKEKIDKCDCGGQLSERKSLDVINSNKTKTNLSNYINLKILLYSILIVIGSAIVMAILSFIPGISYIGFFSPILAGALIGLYLTKNYIDAIKYSFLSMFLVYSGFFTIVMIITFLIFSQNQYFLFAGIIISLIFGSISIVGALIGTYLNKDKEEIKIPKNKIKIPKPNLTELKRYCKDCGEENVLSAKFCVKCGKNLHEKVNNNCNRCGTKNELDATFCKECGHKLDDEINPTPEQYYSPLKSYEGLNAGEFLLILLFSPIAGIIGFISWHDTKPQKAKQAAIIATIMFVLWLIIFGVIFISYHWRAELQYNESQLDYYHNLLLSLQVLANH